MELKYFIEIPSLFIRLKINIETQKKKQGKLYLEQLCIWIRGHFMLIWCYIHEKQLVTNNIFYTGVMILMCYSFLVCNFLYPFWIQHISYINVYCMSFRIVYTPKLLDFFLFNIDKNIIKVVLIVNTSQYICSWNMLDTSFDINK